MQNNQPLVSVVIPCYNHERFVQDTIQSVIDQTYENIELIIIDDGSSDESVKRIKEMIVSCEKRFKRFEFRTRPNKGLCATLNEALEWCEGEFLSAVASDDIWLPYKTKKQIELFIDSKNDDVAVISGEMIIINSKAKNDSKPSFRPPKEIYYKFLDIYRGNARISAPTAMIRMEFLKNAGGYNTDVIIEDLYMWLAITKLGYSIMAVDDIFSKYRIHDGNTFSKIEEMQKSRIKILQYFSPDESELAIAIKRCDLEDFKAAAVYQKKYAFKLLLWRKVNIFSKGTPFYIIVLLVPRGIFMGSINIFRYFRSNIISQ